MACLPVDRSFRIAAGLSLWLVSIPVLASRTFADPAPCHTSELRSARDKAKKLDPIAAVALLEPYLYQCQKTRNKNEFMWLQADMAFFAANTRTVDACQGICLLDEECDERALAAGPFVRSPKSPKAKAARDRNLAACLGEKSLELGDIDPPVGPKSIGSSDKSAPESKRTCLCKGIKDLAKSAPENPRWVGDLNGDGVWDYVIDSDSGQYALASCGDGTFLRIPIAGDDYGYYSVQGATSRNPTTFQLKGCRKESWKTLYLTRDVSWNDPASGLPGRVDVHFRRALNRKALVYE